MLRLGATGSHEIICTLYENCSNITDPYFTWKIERKGTFDTLYFTADDHSSVPYYYNAFTFSIATQSGVGVTQGQLYITPGEYVYEVYEMSTQYDLDINNAIGLVETGLLVMDATFSTINAYTQSNDDTIRYYRSY